MFLNSNRQILLDTTFKLVIWMHEIKLFCFCVAAGTVIEFRRGKEIKRNGIFSIRFGNTICKLLCR